MLSKRFPADLEFKEPGQQEVKSSALLQEELAKLGYKVTGDLKVPEDLMKEGIAKTAFKAEMAGEGPGPTVTLAGLPKASGRRISVSR